MQYTAPALHCEIPGPAGSFDYTRGDSDLRIFFIADRQTLLSNCSTRQVAHWPRRHSLHKVEETTCTLYMMSPGFRFAESAAAEPIRTPCSFFTS